MKPLLATETDELLTRIDHALGGELYGVTMNSPLNFTVELSVQDKNRGYDWINIAFEVDGVSDAKLLEDGKLSMVDMSDGVSILFAGVRVGLAIGKYSSLESLKDSVLYLIGTTLKYEERPFRD